MMTIMMMMMMMMMMYSKRGFQCRFSVDLTTDGVAVPKLYSFRLHSVDNLRCFNIRRLLRAVIT